MAKTDPQGERKAMTGRPLRIGLIGDFDASVPAHQAIPLALPMAGRALQREVEFDWLATEAIGEAESLPRYDGLWCVPASPYRSMDGALRAIQYARQSGLPFLGTCGGFQHALIEYARHVLGWADAEHAETSPDAARAVVTPLECPLVEATGRLRLHSGSRIAAAYGRLQATEGYRCRYGLNPAFRSALLAGPLHTSAEDADGDVRAVELDGHPFFVATLFQPERAALRGEAAPLVQAFVAACAAR